MRETGGTEAGRDKGCRSELLTARTRIEVSLVSGHPAEAMDRRINSNNGQRRERRSLFRPAACPDPVLCRPCPHPALARPPAGPTGGLWHSLNALAALAHCDWPLALRATARRPAMDGMGSSAPPSLSLPVSHSGRIASLSGPSSDHFREVWRRVESKSRRASQSPTCQTRAWAKVEIGIQNVIFLVPERPGPCDMLGIGRRAGPQSARASGLCLRSSRAQRKCCHS